MTWTFVVEIIASQIGREKIDPMRSESEVDVIIYHNLECGTSRNTLGLIRNAGIEPHVIEYLKTPPSRVLLKSLIQRMGASVRDVVRVKSTPYQALKLDDPGLTEDQLLDAMMTHPILINRPIVVTPRGVKLCRPSEVVLDLLPVPSGASSAKRTANSSSMAPASGGENARSGSEQSV